MYHQNMFYSTCLPYHTAGESAGDTSVLHINIMSGAVAISIDVFHTGSIQFPTRISFSLFEYFVVQVLFQPQHMTGTHYWIEMSI